MKPTPDLVQALTNLRPSHDFQVVLEFLLSERKVARDDCETIPEGVKLYRAQGRSVFIRDFLKIVEEAPRHLNMFKAKKVNTHE